jgi:hypothetical protein
MPHRKAGFWLAKLLTFLHTARKGMIDLPRGDGTGRGGNMRMSARTDHDHDLTDELARGPRGGRGA